MRLPVRSAALILLTILPICLLAQDADKEAANAVPDPTGNYWAEKTRDGLRVGVTLIPLDGRVRAGEKVSIQYLLKNESSHDKTLTCNSLSIPMFKIDSQNHLTYDWSTGGGQSNRITIPAGEVYKSEQYKLTISTEGMLPGIYQFGSLSGFFVPDQDKSGHSTTIGSVKHVPLHVTALENSAKIIAPEEGTGIYWGESVCGLRLGAKRVRLNSAGELVEKSERYHTDDCFELQLFLFNGKDTPVEVEIGAPSQGNNWPLSVRSKDGNPCNLEHRDRQSYAGPKFRLKIAPGKYEPFSGVPVAMVPKRGRNVEEERKEKVLNAGFNLVSVENNEEQLDESYRLKAEVGIYNVVSSVLVTLTSNDMFLDATSAPVPFRVEKHPLELIEKN